MLFSLKASSWENLINLVKLLEPVGFELIVTGVLFDVWRI